MTTSSEEILLQVGQVRYKKGDGTLYVMSERLAWMLDHRDTVTVSHRYTDIKSESLLLGNKLFFLGGESHSGL